MLPRAHDEAHHPLLVVEKFFSDHFSSTLAYQPDSLVDTLRLDSVCGQREIASSAFKNYFFSLLTISLHKRNRIWLILFLVKALLLGSKLFALSIKLVLSHFSVNSP